MKFEKCVKESFVIIGKEGSTKDGDDFIKTLWREATLHFNEVERLAKKDEHGAILGFWGAMSDFSRSFDPWQDGFSQGLYLAGVECDDDAEAPDGWCKWVVPGYEYLYVENAGNDTFANGIGYMQENGIPLVGAVHDYNCPQTGTGYLFFPIRRL